MRALTTNKVEEKMAGQAELLRMRLIALGRKDGFADVTSTFDGVACWMIGSSYSSDKPDEEMSSISDQRLAMNGTLCFVILTIATPRLMLLSQNVALHQAIINEVEPGTSMRLSVNQSGPLQAALRFGPQIWRWDITEGVREPRYHRLLPAYGSAWMECTVMWPCSPFWHSQSAVLQKLPRMTSR